MILVGIDTCGSMGTVALGRVESAAQLSSLGWAELAGRSSAAMLVPELERLLRASGLSFAEVGALVVVDGPGSFTGIRIGLATAKGLAEAGSLPVFAISRLRVLAETAQAGFAALDAGRGEFYFAAYGEDAPNTFARPPLLDQTRAIAAQEAELLLTAPELAQRFDQLPGGASECVACEQKVAVAFPAVHLVAPPTAGDALQVALPTILAGQPSPLAELDGRYLRRTELYSVSSPACS